MATPILPQHGLVLQVAHTFAENYPQLARKANGRIQKAIDLAVSGYVTVVCHNRALVRSQTRKVHYTVSTGAFGAWASCDCPDNRRGNTCKHILAVEFAVRAYKIELRRTIEETETWLDRAEFCEHGERQNECTFLNCKNFAEMPQPDRINAYTASLHAAEFEAVQYEAVQ